MGVGPMISGRRGCWGRFGVSPVRIPKGISGLGLIRKSENHFPDIPDNPDQINPLEFTFVRALRVQLRVIFGSFASACAQKGKRVTHCGR
jgi:hypothetical protein